MWDVFISYARDDDIPPPGAADAKGFVTYFYEQLQYEISNQGPERPKFWRDNKRIAGADQFTPMIEETLKTTSYLLVILSPNWLSREWCQRELATFARYRVAEGVDVRQRIIVVGKRFVDRDSRPPQLQGQVGYPFYTGGEDKDEVDGEVEYYSHGKVQDDRYWDRIRSLATYLRHKMKRDAREEQPAAELVAPPSGRTVFLAKPASDMRASYGRLVKELRGKGHAVVPDPAADIPLDSTAIAFIDAGLQEAEISFHLLGEKTGPAPEDQPAIVKLQLDRAAARAAAGGTGFHRLIWAPKLLETAADAQNGAAPAAGATERDPLGVLARFDRQLPTDKIEGDTLSRFVDFLNAHLIAIAPPLPVLAVAPGAGDIRLYLSHSSEDVNYAMDLAAALQQRRIEPMLPVLEGPDAETRKFNDQMLAECDAVALCWASASECWVRAQANRLRDWHGLGRARQFIYRAVIAAPPPGSRKKVAKLLCPPSEIDLIVDLTDKAVPAPDSLDTLVPAARPGT
jgi:TIR domain-containing protein